MDESKSDDDAGRVYPQNRASALPRRQFLGDVAKVGGGLLLGDLAGNIAYAQTKAPLRRRCNRRNSPIGAGRSLTNRFRQNPSSGCKSKGWWPINAAWIVVWSGEEMVGHVLQTQKLLEKRGIDIEWRTFVAAGFSNEAFIPGRIQLANTGALGVLALLANKVPTRALAVHSPALTHAATVPLDSPLKSLADLKGNKVLKRPAVVGTTTGSTNHFGFIAAAQYLGLKPNEDYTLRSMPPGDLATGPKGIDVYHDVGAAHLLLDRCAESHALLEPLDPYYIYSGYYYGRLEIEENAPDVMQADDRRVYRSGAVGQGQSG